MEEKPVIYEPPKKSKLPIILLAIVLLAGACIGGIYIGKSMNKKEETKVEEKKEDKKEETKDIDPTEDEEKEEIVNVDVAKMDENLEMLYWGMRFNLDDYGVQGANAEDFDIFGNLKDGEEILSTESKKIQFALMYALHFTKNLVLEDAKAAEKLGIEGSTGIRAISLSDFKKIYKELYGVEFKDLSNYTSKNHQVEIKNNYIQFRQYTGTFEWMVCAELHFNNLVKKGNEYTLTIDIYYRKGEYPEVTFPKSNDQIIIKSVKDGDVYTIKSMTMKKGN